MKKSIRNCIWYTVTLSFMIFTVTIFVILGNKANYIKAALAASALPQIAGLVFYLHGGRGDRCSKTVRFLLFLCRLSVVGVLFCFLFAVYSLSNEYHNYVPSLRAETASDNVTVVETDDFYIFYPQYGSLELSVGERPSRRDGSVLFCCAAAFQKDYSLSFSYDKICGNYVTRGKRYPGYEDGRMCVFSYYDGAFRFSSGEDAEKELQAAAERGGCAFSQYPVVENGKISGLSVGKCRCYRVLADLDGQLCVIDAKRPCYYHDFAAGVHALGVENALFLDMGSGWNYSWYRNNRGAAKTLIGLPWPFSHNWLTFLK